MTNEPYYIEETTETGYNILARFEDPAKAVAWLNTCQSDNRLELWTKEHASSPSGFAPLAFKQNGKLLVSHTFTFLHLNQKGT